MRVLLKIAASLAALYGALVLAVLAAMYQPPERFARMVAKAPKPFLFVVVPFRPLWSVARAGHLNISDPAPDFDLEAVDHTGRVRLSSFRGQKPVVLVFGSYT